jgi:preprotein translocase subunit SecE
MAIRRRIEVRGLMPACVLRVAGSTDKVKRFLRQSRIEPDKVYWRGELGFLKSRGVNKISGFNISLSGSHGESIEKQAKQATAFIRKYREEMELIKALGFRQVSVDFGLYDLATENRPWPSYHLPSSFVQLVGEFGFDVELSFYGSSSPAP